jgi:hypothetical protein
MMLENSRIEKNVRNTIPRSLYVSTGPKSGTLRK